MLAPVEAQDASVAGSPGRRPTSDVAKPRRTHVQPDRFSDGHASQPRDGRQGTARAVRRERAPAIRRTSAIVTVLRQQLGMLVVRVGQRLQSEHAVTRESLEIVATAVRARSLEASAREQCGCGVHAGRAPYPRTASSASGCRSRADDSSCHSSRLGSTNAAHGASQVLSGVGSACRGTRCAPAGSSATIPTGWRRGFCSALSS